MIQIKNLTKEFKKQIKGDGLKEAIKSLFSHKYKVIKAVNSMGKLWVTLDQMGLANPPLSK